MGAFCALLDCALGFSPCYFLFGCKRLGVSDCSTGVNCKCAVAAFTLPRFGAVRRLCVYSQKKEYSTLYTAMRLFCALADVTHSLHNYAQVATGNPWAASFGCSVAVLQALRKTPFIWSYPQICPVIGIALGLYLFIKTLKIRPSNSEFLCP